MKLSRRAVLQAAVAAPLLASPLLASQTTLSARRRFQIYRGGMSVGEQVIAVRRTGAALEVDIDIDIRVSFLGFTAYTYTMSNREIWQDGVVQQLDARTVENGEVLQVHVERTNDALEVEATRFSGRVTDIESVATTTYWTPAFLERPVWLSTQDGLQYDVVTQRERDTDYPTREGRIMATRYLVRGELPLNLYYDARGEWIGSTFDAGGAQARFIADDVNDQLTALWFGA